MKKILFLITTLLATLILVSCEKKPDNEFTIATWAAGSELQDFREIVKRVNDNADGEYTVKVLSIPSDYYIKLSTQIASRKGPELFWLTQELIPKYSELGAIADISEYLDASDKLNVDDYYEGVIKSARWNDSYWGLPWIANPFMVYYNKTMLDSLGFESPSKTDDWTWEDFIELGEEISKKQYRGKDIYATVFDGHPNIETFIWSGAGDIIGEDGETVLLDSKESIAGIKNLVDMINKGVVPEYKNVTYDGNVWFERQEIAMFIGGIQDNFEYKISRLPEEDQFEIGYAPLPVTPDGNSYSFDWTASTVMSSQVKNKELAYKALEALTLEFFDWKIASPIVGEVDKIAELYPEKQPALETINYVLQTARSANYIPEWGEINDKFLWRGLYQQILRDPKLDYESLTKQMAKEMREYILKERS